MCRPAESHATAVCWMPTAQGAPAQDTSLNVRHPLSPAACQNLYQKTVVSKSIRFTRAGTPRHNPLRQRPPRCRITRCGDTAGSISPQLHRLCKSAAPQGTAQPARPQPELCCKQHRLLKCKPEALQIAAAPAFTQPAKNVLAPLINP